MPSSFTELSYDLALTMEESHNSGTETWNRQLEKSYDQELYRDTFVVEFLNNPLPNEAMFEDLSSERRAYEEDLLRHTMENVFHDNQIGSGEIDLSGIVLVIANYVDQSSLTNVKQKPALIQFMVNFIQTQRVFEDMNTQQPANASRADMSNWIVETKRRIKDIWGNDIEFVNNSAENFARDFTYFDEIIDDLDQDKRPISAKTMIDYDLQIKTHKGLIKAADHASCFADVPNKEHLFKGRVPYWQLATRLHNIRMALGFPSEAVPAFKLFLDIQTPDMKEAFRVSAMGDDASQMIDEIRTQYDSLRDVLTHTTGLTYSFTLHNVCPVQKPLLLQTPLFDNTDDLIADFQDTLLTLQISHAHAVPRLT